MRNDRILRIYTDGGCAGNQSEENFGGWGAILEYSGHTKELYGSEANTTNNRMEMIALAEALEAVKKMNQHIQVFSDSSYLVNCFRNEWYAKWRQNGWKNSSKKPVENRDLWERLLPHLERHRMEFYKVKGHVNLDSASVDVQKHYEKFKENNGIGFTMDDFIHATRMNNRADELANIGIDEIR